MPRPVSLNILHLIFKLCRKSKIVCITGNNLFNPFVNKTTINFFLPESIGKTQLIIFDDRGNVMKTFSLTQKGESTVSFDGSNLKHSIFTYSLVIDGKVADTKKMLH